MDKRAARHKRKAQRTARELALARSKPPPPPPPSMPEGALAQPHSGISPARFQIDPNPTRAVFANGESAAASLAAVGGVAAFSGLNMFTRELVIAGGKPAPELPAHISKDRPPQGCELIPGTGWPAQIGGNLTYRQMLAAIPGEWTAWADYPLADGRAVTVYESFPDGQQFTVYPDGSWALGRLPAPPGW